MNIKQTGRMVSLDTADLRLLRVFVTVVEEGGFAAAQPSLDIALSTISNHVSNLEGRLGVTLCRRGRAGFALTREGEAVYGEAKRVLAAVDGFEGRIGALRGGVGGMLSIGLIDNTITDPRARHERVFARFVERAPGVTFTLVTRPPNELLRDVVSGQIEIAVGSFPRLALGLDYIDLYEERHQFFCGRRHPLFARADSEIDVDTIRAHRIVSRAYWGSRDLKTFALAAPAAVVSDMECEARLILSGAFLGYLPEHYAARWVASGELRAVLPNRFSYRAPFQAAARPAVQRTPAANLFLEILAEEACQPQPVTTDA